MRLNKAKEGDKRENESTNLTSFVDFTNPHDITLRSLVY